MARIVRRRVLRRINHTRNETKRLRALNAGKLRANDIVNHRIRVVCTMLALLTVPASAQEVWQVPLVLAPEYTPSLGLSVRLGTDPYISDDTTLDVVPLVVYDGKHLFSRGTVVGVHTVNNDRFSLDLIARYRFTKLDPDDDAFLDGLDERKQTWEGGLSGTAKGKWGQLKLEWVTDLMDRHDGQEIDLTYRYRFDFGDWMISPFATFSWLDDDITGYYYGVSPAEATPGRPAYAPDAAFNTEFGINTWYQWTYHVFMIANFGVKGLDNTIQDSPLVDKSMVASAFLGTGYLFGNTKKPRNVTGERENEWSWRINYGYAAEKNIFPFLMAGRIEDSERAPSNIAGFTLAKLWKGGRRADIYGKLAAYRHLEGPYSEVGQEILMADGQEDFWSFAAYAMVMGKGYSPWSGKLAFRYGFGFGFSYAMDIPGAEQIKQALHNRETSHLLNYMEFTVDFPIDRLIKSRFTKNCFIGMTAMHRSGLFDTSDLTGEIRGGADWVTLSYECLR